MSRSDPSIARRHRNVSVGQIPDPATLALLFGGLSTARKIQAISLSDDQSIVYETRMT